MFRLGRCFMVLVLMWGPANEASSQVAGQDSAAQLAEAQQLNARAVELFLARRYDEALPLATRVLAIMEKALGNEHPEVVSALNNLAKLYQAKNDFEQALPLRQRALAIREKTLDAEHPDVATALNQLALLYADKGDYVRAEPLFQRVLAIAEKTLGPEHPNVATALDNLAKLYRVKGDFVRAEPLFQRALAIREKALGPEDQDLAASLGNLGLFYTDKEDYVRAEPLQLRALAIWEKTLGKEHPFVGTTLNNLGMLYAAKGDDVRAEPLFKRALDIWEKVLGPQHPYLVTFLNNLAELYRERRDYERAEPLYLRAVENMEKAPGAEHPNLATALSNLASLYADQGDVARAEPLYERALRIREKLLSPEHPDIGTSLNNLALLYDDKSEYARSEPLHKRALAIREKALGAEHSTVATSLNNLAGLYEAKGEYAQAIQFRQRAEEINEHNLSLVLSTGSEGQKQLYLNTLTGNTSATVSLHTRFAPGDQRAAHLALTTILRRKGRALDVMTDQINALRQRATPEDQQFLDQLVATQSQLAKLRLSAGDADDPRTNEQRTAEAARLTTESENLQAAISRRSAEFRVLAQPVTLDAVQQALPAGAALVELFAYLPFDMKATRSARFGAPHYVAYVVKPKGAITSVDLGPTQTIDHAANQFLAAISNPASVDAKETGRALDEIVTRPIRKLIGDVRHVLISPDGQLNLVPFAALVDEQGRYLVENYNISYLTSGRDLLRLNVPRQGKQAPVIIANPAFDLTITGAQANTAATSASNRGPASQTAQAPDAGRSRRSGNMLGTKWRELSGMAQEAKDLKALIPNARVLTGKDATEGALKQVLAPRILHLATHGFFLPDEPRDPNDKVKTVRENPLLRSGLVLAGANTLQGGGDEDGVLTALEAAGLNLWGTKLVVLSACETGVGDVRRGEGVYGLRRALVLAGAESQVMTLWKVDDTATSEVISEYYRRLQAGEGRTAALRQVQLDFLQQRPTRQHPFFWAGFILNGDWRTMPEREAG